MAGGKKGKVFLRKDDRNLSFVPYIIATNRPELFAPRELGDVVIQPMAVDSGYAIGLSERDSCLAMHLVLGTVPQATIGGNLRKDLTSRTHQLAKEYARDVARTAPGNFEFVDETGGPVEIRPYSFGKSVQCWLKKEK
jgi:hypothetical protein